MLENMDDEKLKICLTLERDQVSIKGTPQQNIELEVNK